MKLSNKNKENLLLKALVSEYGLKVEDPIPKKVSIEEVFDDKIVYDIDGQLYEVGYELGEKGEPTFGEPKEITATKIFRTMEALSFENRRALLDTALVTQLGLSKDEHVWIEDMTETEVIYNRDHQAFKSTYVIAEDGVVTFGEPVKVTRQVIYKPMEALQAIYSEILQEAGRRNASLDSGRIKKIVALCQELLSSDEPEEKKAKEALNEATLTLKWLKEQAAMKTEHGIQFPSQAYAYVPDIEKSST